MAGPAGTNWGVRNFDAHGGRITLHVLASGWVCSASCSAAQNLGSHSITLWIDGVQVAEQFVWMNQASMRFLIPMIHPAGVMRSGGHTMQVKHDASTATGFTTDGNDYLSITVVEMPV